VADARGHAPSAGSDRRSCQRYASHVAEERAEEPTTAPSACPRKATRPRPQQRCRLNRQRAVISMRAQHAPQRRSTAAACSRVHHEEETACVRPRRGSACVQHSSSRASTLPPVMRKPRGGWRQPRTITRTTSEHLHQGKCTVNGNANVGWYRGHRAGTRAVVNSQEQGRNVKYR